MCYIVSVRCTLMLDCSMSDRRRPTRPTTQNKSSITPALEQLKQSRIKAAGNTNYKILTRLYLAKDVLYQAFSFNSKNYY